jgi:hypothetical protein
MIESQRPRALLHEKKNGRIRLFFAAGFTLIALSVVGACVSAPPDKGQLCLANDGKARAVIVVPVGAPTTVAFAGQELKHFLDQMTGGDFPICTKLPETGVAIVLGDTQEARAAGIAAETIARDGYAIHTAGQRLFIVGQDEAGPDTDIESKLAAMRTASFDQLRQQMNPAEWAFQRGTLYGVYRFLEEIGVRWFFPGQTGTVVPHHPELMVGALRIDEKPWFLYRAVSSYGSSPFAYIAEGGETRANEAEVKELDWNPADNILWELRMRGSSDILPMNHRPPRTAWVERFATTHPEYFALLANGRRDLDPDTPGYRSHLCYTHPDVMNTMIGDIEAYQHGKNASVIGIDERHARFDASNNGWDPGVSFGNTFSVTPHDSFRACHCDTCSSLLNEGADDPRIRHSRLVFTYVDKLARELKQRGNPAVITCLAYSTYSFPYEDMPPLPDNVVIGVCPTYINRPFYLYCKDNFEQLENLVKNWDAHTDGPLAYWFHYLYRFRRPERCGVPVHIPHMTDRVFKMLAQHGRWMFMQQDPDSVTMEALNRYLMQKLCYDPSLDVDVLVADYVQGLYGSAAPTVQRILDDVEQRCIAMFTADAGQIAIWEEYFPPSVIADYRRMADEAVAQAQGTESETAVRLFSKYYVGLMEEGQARFDKNVRAVVDRADARSCMCAVGDRGPLVIDGKLDEEAWNAPTRTLRFGNNINGKPTEWPTYVKLLWDQQNLYFAFICEDPQTLERSLMEGDADTVEIWLDPQHDHNSCYQILIDMAGRIEDIFFEGGGEEGQPAWESKAEVAVQRQTNQWIVEVAVPRAGMTDGLKFPTGPWGANFCRSSRQVTNPQDRFSRWSPLLFGAFNKPDLFGHIYFTDCKSK